MSSLHARADAVIALAGRHASHEPLILLAALSLAWLRPQNPEAVRLLQYYRERDFPVEALREAALQLFLLAGFQASLEAAFQIHAVFGQSLPAIEPELEPADLKFVLDRGYQLQARVYSGQVEKLRANLSRVSPELEKWTVLVGYGLVMSRPGLPPHWRELLEIAVLASVGFPRQLHSHFRGALNLGASFQEVELILEVSELFSTQEAVKSARQLWGQIR